MIEILHRSLTLHLSCVLTNGQFCLTFYQQTSHHRFPLIFLYFWVIFRSISSQHSIYLEYLVYRLSRVMSGSAVL